MFNFIRKIRWKRLAALGLWLFSVVGFLFLMSFVSKRGKEQKCGAIHIIVPGTQAFVSQAEVYDEVEKHVGPLTGLALKDVPIQQIENTLRTNPFVKNVSVYNDLDGKINIKIDQREAMLRIINRAGQDFYIDKEGIKFPGSRLYAPHVMVANGYITERYDGKQDSVQSNLLKDLYLVARRIATDSLWNSQVEQLYVNEEKDIELVPKLGNQKIVLGTADSIDKKLAKLLVFYQKIVPKVGWGMYKSVNLKFSGQLICEKEDSIIQKEKNNKIAY